MSTQRRRAFVTGKPEGARRCSVKPASRRRSDSCCRRGTALSAKTQTAYFVSGAPPIGRIELTFGAGDQFYREFAERSRVKRKLQDRDVSGRRAQNRLGLMCQPHGQDEGIRLGRRP